MAVVDLVCPCTDRALSSVALAARQPWPHMLWRGRMDRRVACTGPQPAGTGLLQRRHTGADTLLILSALVDSLVPDVARLPASDKGCFNRRLGSNAIATFRIKQVGGPQQLNIVDMNGNQKHVRQTVNSKMPKTKMIQIRKFLRQGGIGVSS